MEVFMYVVYQISGWFNAAFLTPAVNIGLIAVLYFGARYAKRLGDNIGGDKS